MTRTIRGAVAKNRRKIKVKKASGFRGASSNLFTVAKQRVEKALAFSYKGRRLKKRQFRKLWITRINCAIRQSKHSMTYNQFIGLIKQNNVLLNRKMLSQLACLDSKMFDQITETLILQKSQKN